MLSWPTLSMNWVPCYHCQTLVFFAQCGVLSSHLLRLFNYEIKCCGYCLSSLSAYLQGKTWIQCREDGAEQCGPGTKERWALRFYVHALAVAWGQLSWKKDSTFSNVCISCAYLSLEFMFFYYKRPTNLFPFVEMTNYSQPSVCTAAATSCRLLPFAAVLPCRLQQSFLKGFQSIETFTPSTCLYCCCHLLLLNAVLLCGSRKVPQRNFQVTVSLDLQQSPLSRQVSAAPDTALSGTWLQAGRRQQAEDCVFTLPSVPWIIQVMVNQRTRAVFRHACTNVTQLCYRIKYAWQCSNEALEYFRRTLVAMDYKLTDNQTCGLHTAKTGHLHTGDPAVRQAL